MPTISTEKDRIPPNFGMPVAAPLLPPLPRVFFIGNKGFHVCPLRAETLATRVECHQHWREAVTRLTAAGIVAAVWLASAGAAAAQSTGSIAGNVKDTSGAVLPGVTV